MEKDIKRIETRTKYMIFRPDGSMIHGSQSYVKSLCLKWMEVGTIRTWKKYYREGFRCKKVEITYKEL